jgi:hypothetical protein
MYLDTATDLKSGADRIESTPQRIVATVEATVVDLMALVRTVGLSIEAVELTWTGFSPPRVSAMAISAAFSSTLA